MQKRYTTLILILLFACNAHAIAWKDYAITVIGCKKVHMTAAKKEELRQEIKAFMHHAPDAWWADPLEVVREGRKITDHAEEIWYIDYQTLHLLRKKTGRHPVLNETTKAKAIAAKSFLDNWISDVSASLGIPSLMIGYGSDAESILAGYGYEPIPEE